MASLAEFGSLLGNHVIEAKFIRRYPKVGAAITRRAFITNSESLLNSPRGKLTLRFSGHGSHPMWFSPASKNLILAWDLLWQSYRLFGVEGSSIITKIPVSSEKEMTEFWKYFDSNIMTMSPEAKMRFMNT